MGARKIYEEKILRLIEKSTDEELAIVISLIERLRERSSQELSSLTSLRGKYKDAFSSTEKFSSRKQEEKKLES